MSCRQHQQHHRLHFSVAASPPIPVPRLYRTFSPAPATPSSASTPSKRRHSSASASSSSSSSSSSATSLLVVLFSLRSLLPFIRSTPFSFSLFPFCFLVSVLSFALTLLSLVLFPLPPSDPHFPRLLSPQTLTLPLPLSCLSLLHPLAAKSALLTLVYLLRLHPCRPRRRPRRQVPLGRPPRFRWPPFHPPRPPDQRPRGPTYRRLPPFLQLGPLRLLPTVILPSPPLTEGCVRVAPMLLPFVSGFLAYHERAAGCWASLRLLGRRRVQLLDSRPHCCYPLRSGSGQFLPGGGRRWCGIGDECGMASDKYSVFWGDSG